MAELKLTGARFRIHLEKTDVEYGIAMVKNGGENVTEFFYGNIIKTYPFFIQINIAPIDISAYPPVKMKMYFSW